MQRYIVQDVGWYGVIAILVAYSLSSFGILSTASLWYLLLNLSGALSIAYEAGSKRDHQPMVLNIIWALVALIGIARFWIR